MNQGASPKPVPQVKIRVSGQLFEGHLTYLDQLVDSATECRLWPVLNVSGLREVDHAAIAYLADGEGRDFAMEGCPDFLRQRIALRRNSAA